MTEPATLLVDSQDEIGEGPVWNAAEQALYWVDCVNRRIRRHQSPARPFQEWKLARMPASFAFRRGGGLLMASRNTLSFLDLASDTDTPLPTPGIDFAAERFNDGACDRKGRFWVGTMDRLQQMPTGSLYRIDPDLSVHKMDTGVTVSNGICWNPDSTKLYFADSRAGIYVYDFDLEAGTVANRRLFLGLEALRTFPDGCAMDAKGFLWVAEPGSAGVHRYDPDGNRERTVILPAGKPASCAFGGPDLGTLFITTLRHRIAVDPLGWEPGPMDGAVFHARPDVQGLPEPLFAG